MSDNLKLCPFCGDSPIISLIPNGWVVICQGCGGEGPKRSERKRAAAEWNKRSAIEADKGAK